MRSYNSSFETNSLPEKTQEKFRLYLICYRWVSLIFVAILMLINDVVQPWVIWFTCIVAVYNIIATVRLMPNAEHGCDNQLFLLLDLAASAFCVIAGGYMVAIASLNPFFLYSFSSLLAMTIFYQIRDGLLAATVLSLSYFFSPINSLTEISTMREFADTHIANALSFFFVAIIVSQVAGVVRQNEKVTECLAKQEQAAGGLDMPTTLEAETLKVLRNDDLYGGYAQIVRSDDCGSSSDGKHDDNRRKNDRLS